ncbi:hypothetical protein SAMN05192558_12338 [Actinokineospora alba]|uniref:Uncharacterized protein n=1 Tax=Actinokineospora alba TaxID=504798 RepID=A0A1H0WLL6_9PSEU|nr:hypothetical protein [Actinokineospora alba]TDP66262.1 hypothetical protein C8E96_1762 [Actinokineospora alba]SDJ44264.1 hypothetical protein SAMN05421871_115143 [Actinokineospora alba]SDP91584.1 hypothetical protein SAMN05192558_12338 [Actinokineospora alba]
MTDNDKPTDDGSPKQPPPYQPPEPPDAVEARRGSVSYQEPGKTAPRAPSLADQRAREVARRREREAAEAEFIEAERKRKKRKRILIGAGVTVGVVAVVAVIYAASTPDPVTATCTDSNGVVVDEDYCDENYARSHGGYHSGGFIYIGGSSYRYNYGGTGSPGQRVSGGTYVAPSDRTPVKTASGKSVTRGGLGVGGSSTGGKSGGS